MAQKMTGIGVEWTTDVERGEGRERVGKQRRGPYGMVTAVLAVVLIGGVVMHVRRASHPAAPAQPPVQVSGVTPLPSYSQLPDGRWVVTQVRDDGTVQTGFVGVRSPEALTQTQRRFVENNTTNLPNAATADTLPVATGTQQRFGPAEHDRIQSALELADGATAGMAPSGLSSSQLRFLEVNTELLPAVSSYPYAEDLTPPLGQRR